MIRKLASAFLLPSIVFLTSCADRPSPLTELRLVPQEIPAVLLSCAEEPEAPKPGATWQEFFGWIVDVRAAGNDCRARVEAIRELQKP